MAQEQLLTKIDDAAILWNKTKDPKYKDLWYKLIKEFNHGSYNTERWNVSVSSVNKACLLYTSPSPRDRTRSRMPSSA